MRSRIVVLALGLVLLAAIAPVAPAAPAAPRLFDDAIGRLQEEANLLPQAGPNNASAPNFAQIKVQLQTVDGLGDDLLQQLRSAGVEPSPNLRRTLGRLPVPGSAEPLPQASDYTAAIAELGTLKTARPRLDAGSGPAGRSSVALIAIAGALLAGLTALALWRRTRTGHHADLMAIAMTDGLTSLNNRRKLDLDLQTLRAGPPVDVAALMIDVDHFKQVNDVHGHGVGDEVLRRVAAELRAQMRPGDVLYRYGGEEFCVLLTQTQLLDGGSVGERVRAAISSARMPIAGPITVSVGVGAGRSTQIVDVMAHADVALLDAKRAGRNRVEVWAFAAAPVAATS